MSILRKLLISDYDNTLYTDEKTILNNIKKVKEFRKNGNYFIISTSRGYVSIMNEIEKYNIPYDYICTNNGAAIFDKYNKIIYKNFLKTDDFIKIEKILESYYDVEVTRYYLKSIKIQDKKNNTDTHRIIPKELIGYKIKGNLNILNMLKEKLENALQNFDITIKENKKLFINAKENKKENAIEKILNLNQEKLNPSELIVYTIGDDDVDFNMLKMYNGFRMENSSDLLRKNIKNMVKSVGELLCHIESQS